MGRYDSSSVLTRGNDNRATTDDARTWVGDDLISERVTDAVRRWLEGMENAIATANSEREI